MSIYKTRVTMFDYSTGNCLLRRTPDMEDLGLTFDAWLIFHWHINSSCKRSSRTLTVVMRVYSYFVRHDTLVIFHKFLIRSTRTYESLIWNPYYNNQFAGLKHIDFLVGSLNRNSLDLINFSARNSCFR